MPAKILYRDAQGRDGAVELRAEPVWIGRAMDCAIRTDDAMVSRKHSMIRFDQGRYWVEDLGSSNGTHVNDVKVTRQALNHNDVVRCGSLWLRYIEEGPIGMGAGAGPSMGPRTVAGGGPPVADFGFASTVATPRTQAPPPSSGSDSMGGSTSFGGRNVVVDMGTGGGDSRDAMRYRQQADDLRSQLDLVRAERDKEVAENKRMRAEISNLQQRIDDARTQFKETEEVVLAHKRVAEELRSDTEQIRDRDQRMQTQLTEAQEDLQSRSRQLQRAQDDITKLKQEIDTFKKQVSDLSRIKDDGFRKLNEQLAEVEHLREVIREQERMLEERRVGLISLEEGLKDLRADREQRIKEAAALRGERDELRIGFNRQQAQLQSTEEENRRLGRLMQDISDSGEVMRLSRQLKDAQFEAESQESEKNRIAELLRGSEQRIEKLQEQIEKLEAASSSEDSRARTAVQEMRKSEEGRVKAESARARAELEKNAALKAKEALEEELTQLRARGPAAESAPSAPVRSDAGADRRMADLQAKLEAAKKYADASRELDRLQAANDELAKKLKAATTAEAKKVNAGDTSVREKALEVYNNVNDVLAELRVNISVVRDEFAAFAGKNADTRARTIRDAIEAAAGQTEDVKGVLRNLREVAEG
jgi:predicted  nucleic acid-binding Zn-ribbon protein